MVGPDPRVELGHVIDPAGPRVGAPVAVIARRSAPGTATVGGIHEVARRGERLPEPPISPSVLAQAVLHLDDRERLTLGRPVRACAGLDATGNGPTPC